MELIDRWAEDPEGPQVFRVDGVAGGGKTSTTYRATRGIKGTVLSCAPTAKAALVMRRKNWSDTVTIHKLIYHSREKAVAHLKYLEDELQKLLQPDLFGLPMPTLDMDKQRVAKEITALRRAIEEERRAIARPMFTLNPCSPVASAACTVMDEGSMVDSRVGSDTVSFKTKILVMQDPNQLPPVASDDGRGFFMAGNPNFELTQVHRQAKNSPVIRLATQIREEKENFRGFKLGTYDGVGGPSRVFRRADVTKDQLAEMAREAQQIIVGKNDTRRSVNKAMRKRLGYWTDDELPTPGDKLVCLRNNYDEGMLNGQLYTVQDVSDREESIIGLTLISDEGDHVVTTAHAAIFKGEKVPPWNRRDANEFDYGYALTCHKAQGSQWDRILIFDEHYVFRQDGWRWAYTAATRAAKQFDWLQ